MSITIAELLARIGVDDRALQSGLSRAEQRLDRFADKAQKTGKVLSLGLSAPIALVGKAAFDAAVQMDSLKRGLTSVAGSTKEAERQLVRLKEVAKLPGLGFEEAIQGSINLQAAGMSAERAEKALQGFGNALATVGKGKAELDGVVLALTQIQSKGKVSAEEINQISERVPQMRKLMLQAFGTADTEVIQKSKLTAQQFVDGIIQELERLPRVQGGIQNDLENANDAIKQGLAELGGAIIPLAKTFLDELVPAVQQATRWFRQLSPEQQELFVKAGLLAAALGPLAIAFGHVASGISSVLSLSSGLLSFFLRAGGAAGTAAGQVGAFSKALKIAQGLAATPLGKGGLIAGSALGGVGIGTAIDQTFGAPKYDRQAAKTQAEMDAFNQVNPAFAKYMGARDRVKRVKGYFAAGGYDQKEQAYIARLEAEMNALRKSAMQERVEKRRPEAGTPESLGPKAIDYSKFIVPKDPKKPKLKKPKLTESQRQTEALRDQIADLAKSIDLGGDMSEQAALKWEILHGQYKKAAPAVKQLALALADKDARMSKAREAADRYKDAIQGVFKQTALSRAEGELDRAEVERKYGAYKELTEAQWQNVRAAVQQLEIEEKQKKQRESALRVLEQFQEKMDLLALSRDERQVVAAAGGMGVWKELSDADKAAATQLFHDGQAGEALDDARQVIAQLRQEAELLAKSPLERAAMQAQGGAEKWAKLTEALKQSTIESVGLRQAQDALNGLKDDYAQRAKESFDTVRTAAQAAEEQIAKILETNQQLASDPRLGAFLQGIRDAARQADTNRAGKLTRGLGEGLDAQLTTLKERLAGVYDPAKDAVRQWEQQNKEAIAELTALLGDDAYLALKSFREKVSDAARMDVQLQGVERMRQMMAEVQKKALLLRAANPFDAYKVSLMELDAASGQLKLPTGMDEEQLKRLFDYDAKLSLAMQAAEGIRSTLVGAFEDAYQHGFKGFFDNVIQGFERMLRQMAAEYLASQLTNLFLGALGGMIGAPPGGAGAGTPPFAGFRALGGPVSAGHAYVVGERRPELFVPDRDGTIVPSVPQAQAAGGPQTVVYMTVHAKDAASFNHSRAQIAQDLGRQIDASRRRLGER